MYYKLSLGGKNLKDRSREVHKQHMNVFSH